MTKPTFDIDAAVKALQKGQSLTEAATQAELENHLEHEDTPNRKNGSTTKTVKSLSGSFELETPRDRANTFEP